MDFYGEASSHFYCFARDIIEFLGWFTAFRYFSLSQAVQLACCVTLCWVAMKLYYSVFLTVTTFVNNINGIVEHRQNKTFYSRMYTKTVCENENVRLSCPEGKIEVADAFFGRESSKKCYTGPSADSECASPEGSTAKVQQECNYKRACTIPANQYFFTSGCQMNISKYLDVAWTCVAGPPYRNKYACEHDVLDINCKKKFIKIYEAFYGRNDVNKCNDESNVAITTNTCLSRVDRTSFELTKRCDDRHRCRVKVEHKEINKCCVDPCPGQPKFLSVNYFCLDARKILYD